MTKEDFYLKLSSMSREHLIKMSQLTCTQPIRLEDYSKYKIGDKLNTNIGYLTVDDIIYSEVYTHDVAYILNNGVSKINLYEYEVEKMLL